MKLTRNAAVHDFKELLVTTRVAEESRVDGDRALAAAGARAVQREVHVEVAVARERDATQLGHQRVVASVPGCLPISLSSPSASLLPVGLNVLVSVAGCL